MTGSPVVALHNHTEYSEMDGTQRLDAMCRAVAADTAWEASGIQPSVAITDHGTLAGAWDFVAAAEEHGIKPIIGVEAYMTPGTSRFDKTRVRWADGGDAELHVWPGGYHAFEVFAPQSRLAQEMTAARDNWIRRILD